MYSIRVKENGIELYFGGFNDKLLLLVEVVMNSLFSNDFIAARFDVMKEDLLREYRNAIIKAGMKGKYLRGQLLDQAAFRLEDGIKALEHATPEILRNFLLTTLWSSKGFYHALIHGNISTDIAIEISKMLETRLFLISAPIDETQLPLRLIRILPVSSNGLLIQEPSEHLEDKNTLVDIYFQIGVMSLELLAYTELLHQLMAEPLFDTLRTKQELGYEVSCTVHITHGILGFSVKVQSSDFAPEYLSLCMDRFLIEFAEAIDLMTDEHFKDHINAQIMKKIEPKHNLLELSQRLWVEISSRRFEFEMDAKVVEILKASTKKGMLDFYKRFLLGKNQSNGVRKLYVYVIGRSSPMKMASETILDNPPTLITNLDVYKTQLDSYPESVTLTK
jgi:secreted Zn-dependent insulinase-like peptidase